MSIPANEGMEGHEEESTFSRLLLLQQQQRAMLKFWMWSQEQIDLGTDNWKLTLPTSRLRNVIRARANGMLISADLPVFVTKLCELFIQELTLRAWVFAQSQNRNILLDIDIVNAIVNTESYHFLADVVRRHQVAKLTMSNTTVAKRHRPNKMNLSYHHTQTINVSPLVDYLPFVGISPMALMGGKGDMVSITSACDMKKMNNLRSMDSLNVVIDTTSRDAATVNHQGRTTQPISFKDTCASLEDNYVVSDPVGHDDITDTGDDDDVNQLWNEEKNYGVHFLGEGNFSKESLLDRSLGGTMKDDALLFSAKDFPLICYTHEEYNSEKDIRDDICSNSSNNAKKEPNKEQTE
uniref:Transcription factor CBF/NF-Y/archaeal histone domain-containing protein n=1 Tax=Leersia perrieri TaxID=77586 RepID=A0A0D9XIG6_9ORYZ